MSGKWHVATQPQEADRHLAAAARLRRVLRHDHRRRQLLRSRTRSRAATRTSSTRRSATAASSTPTRSATRPCAYIERAPARARRTRRSSRTSPIPRRTGRCTRTTRTSRSTAAASTPAGTRCARRASTSWSNGASCTAHWKLTERDPTQPPWSEAEHKAVAALRCMEVYAAQIDRMDQGIGRIVAALEQNGTARQHARHLPRRQRRLRGRHSGRRHRRRARRQADDRAAAHARAASRCISATTPAHARAGEHVPELRHRVGQPLEHARSASTSTGSTKAASRRR